MQKLSIQQQLSQKLSPQQIQFIKLLQIPAAELESRIEEELEINPALEEGKEEEQAEDKDSSEEEFSDSEEEYSDDDLDLQEYIRDEDVAGYKMQGDGPSQDDEERESPIAGTTSLTEMMLNQLGFLRLDERQKKIAEQLIGSIDEDGYIRRNLDLIVDDLAFSQNIETTIEEIEEVLFKIQDFDPAGIGARDLQECLLLQIERRHLDEPEVLLAHHILKDCFEEFTKKHYDKIQKKYDVDDESIKAAVNIITKLNPKPGGNSGDDIKTQYLMPDFILQTNNGQLELFLNSKNAPDLRVSRNYSEMFDTYDKSAKTDKKLKEAVTFVKQKLDAAKWFIEAIKQRQQTLLKTMHAILEFQKEFFFEGDETFLKPMILKDIADMVSMDISTISRVANSKAIQTEFGIYP
ncbi:MAG TPA: RNA polymerase factor sigma-54, partial [Cytophaga sp.]|nr:RNA polymerase factor sigma-54 [Cytophaga sp.]